MTKTLETDVMTDNQWDNMVKMMAMIVRNCETIEDALLKMRMLCRNPEDIDKIIENKKPHIKGD